MKRNGDIKLAALPAEARAVLHATGLDRLFEFHDTIADAVNSYHHLPATQIPANQRSGREAKSAAW
jgi:hypothetical protein